MLYVYRQNNSGGSFIKPARSVAIEADTPGEADKIALNHGLYFDSQSDCDCCGSRWEHATENDAMTREEWRDYMESQLASPFVDFIKSHLGDEVDLFFEVTK